jgi:hypothetical protein
MVRFCILYDSQLYSHIVYGEPKLNTHLHQNIEVAAEWSALLLHIQEVPESNLGSQADYSEVHRDLFQYLQQKLK